ncbi:MAG: sulfatase [Chloroflexia bacterium]|nr:sulfatase [Chloroflexia bacterium]
MDPAHLAQPAQHQPNVLWILSDQMRAQTVGYAGDPNVHTPNLDRLAAEGVTFTHAVTGTPLCSPCRGSLLTSQYPHQHGVAGHNYPLPKNARTVAHAFRDAGYRTAWLGKWHLDGDRPEIGVVGEPRTRIIPPARRGGFQDWWGYENNNRPFDCLVHTDRDGRTEQFRLPSYETDALTDLFIAWIEERAAARARGEEGPFFGVLSVQPPHDPYVAPAEVMARHSPGGVRLRANVPLIPRVVEQARRELAGYCAAVERLDWNVGRIRAALDALGIRDETYVVFFSDHGDMLGSHGQFRKTSPWEESIRVPFIIGGPSREHQEPRRTDVPINHVDVAPTSLGLCGIAKPVGMVGSNCSHVVIDGRPPVTEPDSAYLSIPVPTGHSDSVDRPWRGVVTRDGWKYVCLEGQPWLLFNLDDDPYELANLAHNTYFGAERRRLHDCLKTWIDTVGDSFLLPEV